MDLDTILNIDQQLLLFFNGSDSLFLDGVVSTLTNGLMWIPLYLSLFYLIIKNNETMVQIGLIIGCVALTLLLTDGMADGICKPMIARWRPSNDPILKYSVDIVNNTRGSDYGFFSAHAANTMGLAVFFALLVRSRLLSITMIAWSVIEGWTRMYLGLHYPLDVLTGWTWGAISGLIGYLVCIRFYYRMSPKINYISSQYTRTGYDCADINVVMFIYAASLLYAILKMVITA